jgi:hypothetical protein
LRLAANTKFPFKTIDDFVNMSIETYEGNDTKHLEQAILNKTLAGWLDGSLNIMKCSNPFSYGVDNPEFPYLGVASYVDGEFKFLENLTNHTFSYDNYDDEYYNEDDYYDDGY